MIDTKQIQKAMVRALFAKKEHGLLEDVVLRYSIACHDLSRVLSVDLNFLEMGQISNDWLKEPSHSVVKKQRLLMSFWRDMLQWLLAKATSKLTSQQV